MGGFAGWTIFSFHDARPISILPHVVGAIVGRHDGYSELPALEAATSVLFAPRRRLLAGHVPKIFPTVPTSHVKTPDSV